MHLYRTTQVLGFAAGAVLALTAVQAASRQHALEPLNGGRGERGHYRATREIEFKAGEVVGILELEHRPPFGLEPVNQAAAAALPELGKPKGGKGKGRGRAAPAPGPGQSPAEHARQVAAQGGTMTQTPLAGAGDPDAGLR